MRKVVYLMTMIFAVALMSTSCEKEDPIVPNQTLPEQYPDWVNLSSIETTDVFTNIVDYPTLDITIVGNEMTVVQTMWNNVSEITFILQSTWPADEVIITNDDVILAESVINGELTGTYTKNGSEIILKTTGFSDAEYTYVLQPQ